MKTLPIKTAVVLTTIALGTIATTSITRAAGPRDAIISGYAQAAGGSLSGQRGQALFTGTHTGGKPDTPSCTTCHTKNLKGHGRTRAGKDIFPMAVSANPDRFTDPKKVEKWFRRNCKSVLGRECTAQEKGDVLTYLSSI